MNSSSLPSPQEKHQLFKADVDWRHNACLNAWFCNLDIYARGYKRAGDLLVEHIKKERAGIDFLVFPTVFLYRQYIELRLKELIISGSELLGLQIKTPKQHKINELWKQCRKVLEQVYKGDPITDLNMVESSINQFSEADPYSTAFRYPTDTKDNPSLPNLSHINLRHLADTMEKIASLLDGASMGIDAGLGSKKEAESEYCDNF